MFMLFLYVSGWIILVMHTLGEIDAYRSRRQLNRISGSYYRRPRTLMEEISFILCVVGWIFMLSITLITK